MLSRLSRLTSRRSAAAPLRLAAARALSIESFKGVSHPLVPGVGQPKNIQKEDYMHADMVLEEEKTGFPPGLPLKRDSEIWQNPQDPNQLVRAHCFCLHAPRSLSLHSCVRTCRSSGTPSPLVW